MSLPPIAKKIPHTIEIHGEKLTDNYAWLRDREWPNVKDEEVLEYLRAENAYYQNVMTPLNDNIEKIYQEIKGRIKLEDSTYPIKKEDYYYYSRTTTDSNYSIFCRKKERLENEEEVILDVNEFANELPYFDLGALSVSPDHTLLIYSADTTGGERYEVSVKDLKTSKLLEDKITNNIGNIVWHKNGKGFFYTKLNEQWRTDKVYYHKLGTSQAEDKLILQEDDPIFRLSIEKSNSEELLFIYAESKDYNEVRFLDFNESSLDPMLIEPRRKEHLYYAEYASDYLYIKTNDKGKNFRLVKTNIKSPNAANWQEMIAHNEDIYLTDIFTFKSKLAAHIKKNGLSGLIINDYEFKNSYEISFPDPVYHIAPIYTTFESSSLRFSYSSLNSPEMIMENSFLDNTNKILKVKKVLGGYDKSDYASERKFAKSSDGTLVPISIVYRKDMFKQDGSNPLYLYGYGSYGAAISARFRSEIISLLDRGFVYAIAHIRGGDDMGYYWYEDGKLLNKKNTFNDFIACAEYLIANKYTAKQNIGIAGGSAGGMLVGACVNERPDLFKVVVGEVPFVDVLNTMLDDSLPLTPGEFTEWGNPKDEEYYYYIKSYCPYSNVKKQDYPTLYITAGLSDPRVTYWEPAKWVAKLREYKTDNNILVLKTNMDAGHCGNSGRFGYLKDIAEEYSFIFKIFGIKV